MSHIVMGHIVTGVDELDLEISVAFIALGSARTRFDRCPSGENQRRVDEAVAEVDRLLDERLVLEEPRAA
jgi:hypothetical protein